tara:strand:- start:5624 stop:6181 length:558 start_codon:yes stop_codon:yes gene_type:complete
MANITTILGTDSISSSRIVLNDNFTATNSELTTISGLYNATYTNHTLTGTVQAATLLVPSGILINSSLCTITPGTVFDGEIKINNGLKHSFSTAISVAPSANSYTLTTYLWDAAATNVWALNAGDPGQEITIIAQGGTLTLTQSGIIAHATADVVMTANTNVMLRYIGAFWYVISHSSTGVTYTV